MKRLRKFCRRRPYPIDGKQVILSPCICKGTIYLEESNIKFGIIYTCLDCGRVYQQTSDDVLVKDPEYQSTVLMRDD